MLSFPMPKTLVGLEHCGGGGTSFRLGESENGVYANSVAHRGSIRDGRALALNFRDSLLLKFDNRRMIAVDNLPGSRSIESTKKYAARGRSHYIG